MSFMEKIWDRHKKGCIVILTLLLVILFGIYLRAMLLTGVWHSDAFLYRQNDGSFEGSDMYGVYRMNIEKVSGGAEIDFSVNDTKKHYKITDNSSIVKIFENNALVFEGRARDMGGVIMLEDKSGEFQDIITVRVGGVTPSVEELFPTYTRLYSLAIAEKYDVRGNFTMFFLMLLAALFLFLDLRFPNLFWILEHRMEVDGGEPSDWYRFGQSIGRIILAVGILVLVIMSFVRI